MRKTVIWCRMFFKNGIVITEKMKFKNTFRGEMSDFIEATNREMMKSNVDVGIQINKTCTNLSQLSAICFTQKKRQLPKINSNIYPKGVTK